MFVFCKKVIYNCKTIVLSKQILAAINKYENLKMKNIMNIFGFKKDKKSSQQLDNKLLMIDKCDSFNKEKQNYLNSIRDKHKKPFVVKHIKSHKDYDYVNSNYNKVLQQIKYLSLTEKHDNVVYYSLNDENLKKELFNFVENINIELAHFLNNTAVEYLLDNEQIKEKRNKFKKEISSKIIKLYQLECQQEIQELNDFTKMIEDKLKLI
jgi:hypothetical protein